MVYVYCIYILNYTSNNIIYMHILYTILYTVKLIIYYPNFRLTNTSWPVIVAINKMDLISSNQQAGM